MKNVTGFLSGGGGVIWHLNNVFTNATSYISEWKGRGNMSGGGTSVCNALMCGLGGDWWENAEKEGTVLKGFVKKLVFKLLNLFETSPNLQVAL